MECGFTLSKKVAVQVNLIPNTVSEVFGCVVNS